MKTTARPFTVVADGEGRCMTHCSSLQSAVRSAKGFSSTFTSIVILKNGEVVRVIR